MKRCLVILMMVILCILSAGSMAQAEYPTKAITIVAPYGPGGASDLAGRTLAAVAGKYIGQPTIVINRTGAGGVTGSTYVSKSRPDGYTLLVSRIGCNGIYPALNSKGPYKWDDFTFLALLELNPFVYVVKSDSPYKTLDDLLQALKKNPGKLSYSISGPTTALAIGPQVLFDLAGLPSNVAKPVPYKGGGGAKTALMGGHVDFLGINLSTVMDAIQGGALRPLAVNTKERLPQLKDCPTVRELGYPHLEKVVGWSGLYGPPNMKKETVEAWQAALQKVKKDKAWNKMTKALGSIPQILSPEETYKFYKEQYEFYTEVGKKLGLSR